ncbi:MAG: alpha/beta hydrolase [Neomegalonema sp.]|nr:alpha/beta hydrolase [Neomegalonema sp.]
MKSTKKGPSTSFGEVFEAESRKNASDDAQWSGPRGVYEARYPPIGQFETVRTARDATRMHLFDVGPTDSDDAIVLIHGASGNLRDFAFSFMERLAEHPAGRQRRLIAIDRPGFGYSERGPGAAHEPEAQARLMQAAVALRGVRRVLLVGHSLGAASTLAWALEAPQMVRGLVLLGGLTHAWSGSAGVAYDVLSAPYLGAAVAHIAAAAMSEERAIPALENIFAPQSPPPGYAEFVGVGLALRRSTIRANGEDVGKIKPLLRAQAARYAGIKAPIAIVHGAEDTIVPAAVHALPLAETCPSADLIMLDGIGHMPHHVAVEPILDAIYRLNQQTLGR